MEKGIGFWGKLVIIGAKTNNVCIISPNSVYIRNQHEKLNLFDTSNDVLIEFLEK